MFDAYQAASAALGTIAVPVTDPVSLYLVEMMSLQGGMPEEWAAALLA